MAEYSKLYITNNGQALMAKMIAGSGNIDFTKVCSSSTQYTESQLQALTALSNIKQTTLVSKVTRTNEVAIKIDAAYSNVDLKEGYYMRTLGLYAVDPDKGEILYAVCIEKSNNCYMPPYNGVTVSAAYLQLYTTVRSQSMMFLTRSGMKSNRCLLMKDTRNWQKVITDVVSVHHKNFIQKGCGIYGSDLCNPYH